MAPKKIANRRRSACRKSARTSKRKNAASKCKTRVSKSKSCSDMRVKKLLKQIESYLRSATPAKHKKCKTSKKSSKKAGCRTKKPCVTKKKRRPAKGCKRASTRQRAANIADVLAEQTQDGWSSSDFGAVFG